MSGKFIVVEGVRGSGKTTLINTALAACAKVDIPLIHVQDFGTDPFCERMRDDFLNPERPWTARLAMAYASKAFLQENVIVPALKMGKNVLCERWYHSIEAYLLYPHSRGPGTVSQANDLFEIRTPDVTVVCTVDFEVAMERLRKAQRKLNLFEEKGEDFMRKVCRYYNSICGGVPADTLEVGMDVILRAVGART